MINFFSIVRSDNLGRTSWSLHSNSRDLLTLDKMFLNVFNISISIQLNCLLTIRNRVKVSRITSFNFPIEAVKTIDASEKVMIAIQLGHISDNS